MLALRITVVLAAFAVHSACVDPDRILRLRAPDRPALGADRVADHADGAARGRRPRPAARGERAPRPGRRSGGQGAAGAAAGRRIARPRGRRRRDARAARLRPRRPARRPDAGPPGATAPGSRSRARRRSRSRSRPGSPASAGSRPTRPSSSPPGAPTLALAAAMPLLAAAPFAGTGVRRTRRLARPDGDRDGRARSPSSPGSRTRTRAPGARRSTGSRSSSAPASSRSSPAAPAPASRPSCGRSAASSPTTTAATSPASCGSAGSTSASTARPSSAARSASSPRIPEAQVVSTTVRGELELPLDLRGEPAAARARAVEEAALALGIAALLDRPTDSLSGGELQRVALAAALVLRPRLVLLDEPTSQLDPVAGDELVGLLRRLNEEWGMSVVLAEHRLERCLAAADRVVALDRRPGQLRRQPVRARRVGRRQRSRRC